jgi:hypothetical protein
MAKSTEQNDVLSFLIELKHPLKKEIEELRLLVLSVDKNITEHIKWNAPSFCYQNDDRITMNFAGKGFIRLVFHCGAKTKAKAEKRLFDDTTGLLEWAANDRAIAKFTSMEDLTAKKKDLVKIIKKWLELTTVE